MCFTTWAGFGYPALDCLHRNLHTVRLICLDPWSMFLGQQSESKTPWRTIPPFLQGSCNKTVRLNQVRIKCLGGKKSPFLAQYIFSSWILLSTLLFTPGLFIATAFAEALLGFWVGPLKHTGHADAPSHPVGSLSELPAVPGLNCLLCQVPAAQTPRVQPQLCLCCQKRGNCPIFLVNCAWASVFYVTPRPCHFREVYYPVFRMMWVNKGNSPSMRPRPALHVFLSTRNKSAVRGRRSSSAACAAHMRWRRSRGSASTSQNLCSCTELSWLHVAIQTRHAAVWNLGMYGRENAWGLQITSLAKQSALPKIQGGEKICPGNPGCLVGIPKLASW